MQTIESIFHRLGLSDQEIEVYMILLQGGRQSTTTMAKKLNKPRTTLYTYIDSLSQQGLIQKEQVSRGQRFNALPFDDLIASIEQRKRVFDNAIEEFHDLRETYENTQNTINLIPKIKIYETKEARNLVYKKIQNFSEAYSIFNYDKAIEFLQRNKRRREQAGIMPDHATVHEILIDSPEARIYKKKREKENQGKHHIKLIDTNKLGNIQSDILLVDGIYYHTSLDDRIMMIEINDPIFYKSQKTIFEYLRQTL